MGEIGRRCGLRHDPQGHWRDRGSRWSLAVGFDAGRPDSREEMTRSRALSEPGVAVLRGGEARCTDLASLQNTNGRRSSGYGSLLAGCEDFPIVLYTSSNESLSKDRSADPV